MVVKGDAMRRLERTPSLWFPLPRRLARGGPLLQIRNVTSKRFAGGDAQSVLTNAYSSSR